MIRVKGWRVASILFIASLSIACSRSLNGEYRLDTPSDTQPDIRITKVIVSEGATIIRLRIARAHDASSSLLVGVHPPGHQLAFYIMSTDRSKRFNLVDIEGITIRPSITRLNPGEGIEFNLTFERIDDSMSRFHLLEGEAEASHGTPWHFLNVALPET